MIISPYDSGINVLQTKAYTSNTELLGKVLLHKQTQFDSAYQGIQKLRKESLNINFINKREQARIDEFNKGISETFDQLGNELGDLSNRSVTKGYTDMFNLIGQDVALINNYKKDVGYQRSLQDIYKKRDSKDPKKQGYHQINHLNYERRLNDYANADLRAEDVTVKPYVNYVDYNKEIRSLIKEVPEEDIIEERRMGDGTIMKITKKGRDPKKVQALVNKYLSGDAATQVREEAEFYYHNNKGNNFKEQLYTESQAQINQSKIQLQNEVKKLKAGLSGLSGEELMNVSGAIAKYEDNIVSLDKQLMNFSDFSEKSDDDLVNTYSGMYVQDLSRMYGSTLGGYTHSVEHKTDQAYWNAKNLQRAYQNDAFDRSHKAAILGLKQAEFDLNTKKFELEAGTKAKGEITSNTLAISQGIQAERVAGDILFGITKITAEQNEFLKNGIKGTDMMNPLIKQGIDKDIARLKDELATIQSARGGIGLVQSQETKDQVASKLKEIKEAEAQLSEVTLSPTQLAKTMVDDPDFFNYPSSVVKDAPDIIALEEAIDQHMVSNQIQRRSDIKDYTAIVNLAEEIKNTAGTRANTKKTINDRYVTNANRMMKESGLDLNATAEEQKKVWDAYIKTQTDLIPHFQNKVFDLDFTKVSGKPGQALVARADYIQGKINSGIQSVGPDINGRSILTKGSIKNDDLLLAEEATNGSLIITFNPKSLEEGGNLYNKYIRDADGHLIEPTAENNRVIISNNSASTVSIFDDIGNRISKVDNLRWDVGSNYYHVKKNAIGDTYTFSINGGSPTKIRVKDANGITNDAEIHNHITNVLNKQ